MKARTVFSPKNGVHDGEDDAPSHYSKESKRIRDKKTRRVASKARRRLKCGRLSLVIMMRKTKRRKKKRKNVVRKSQCHGGSVAQEAVNQECLAVCDKIEKNVFDTISAGETFRQSLLNTDGGLENVWSSTVACPGKESVAEDIKAVIISAEILWLLEGVCTCSTHFSFTANAVSLEISDGSLDSTIMGWPLNMINSFCFYACQQAGYTVLELALSESGVEALKKKLEELRFFNEHGSSAVTSDLFNCKGYCITAKMCDLDWPEKKRQIMSLSNAYESLWRPLRMEITAGKVSGSSLMRTNELWTSVDKESFAEEVTEVIIKTDALWLLEGVCVYSSQFSFTADTISLNISDGYLGCPIIKWPLNEITNIASDVYEQESCILFELGLTESGAEALKRTLEESPLNVKDDFAICRGNCLMAKISDVDWPEQRNQIISLSESYKALWRHLKLDMFAEQDFETFQGLQSSLVPKTLYRDDFEREDLIDSEEEGSNDNDEDGRYEASWHGWFDIVYPKEDHDAVTVTQNDFLLLNPEEFISDTIIDFYIKYLQSTLSEQDQKRFYFFNSFFFRKLTEVDRAFLYGCDKPKSTFERVKRWTAKINILEKDYLFIPIMESAHWSLIIICFPGYISAECAVTSKAPLILHLDSLEGCHTGLEEPIRNYLTEAWMHGTACKCEILPCSCKRFSDVNFVSAKVPQQTNYSDCGLFLLHYVELFIRDVQAGNFPQFVTSEWFDPIEASSKRVDIQNLILQLRAEELDARGVVLGCLDIQDSVSFSRDNGGLSANSSTRLQEVLAMGNRDQASIVNDFERMNMFHSKPFEQMGGARYSHLLNYSNQMCMDTFNRHDDSMVGVDLYPKLSLDALAQSCQLPLNGSYKQLFMLCHSGAKFSLDHAREEDFSGSEQVYTNPVSEDPNSNSINISVNGNTLSRNVCMVSNPYFAQIHNTISDTRRLSTVNLEGTSDGMAAREMSSSSTVDDRINWLPVSCKQRGLTMDSGTQNMESSRSNIENDIQNYRLICNVEREDSCPSVFQESASKDIRPPSSSSTPKLNTNVCLKESESKVEFLTERSHKEDEYLDDKDNYRVTAAEDINSIHKELSCALPQEHQKFDIPYMACDEDQNFIQKVSRLEHTQYISSSVGQSAPDHHQAQPGLEVENILENTSKEDITTSTSFQQRLSTVVCSNKTESTDQIYVNRSQKEDESVHNCEVISSEGILSTDTDSYILKEEHKHSESPDRVCDEDLSIVQNILKLESTHCLQSQAGQCTANHQPQPGLKVENTSDIAKITKPNSRKKLLDSEIVDSAGRRPITRSATRKIDDKTVTTVLAQQGRKRKSLTEAIESK